MADEEQPANMEEEVADEESSKEEPAVADGGEDAAAEVNGCYEYEGLVAPCGGNHAMLQSWEGIQVRDCSLESEVSQ